jgi:hypothetical protein
MAVLIILAVFSVPLTAIVSSTWLKAKRIEAQGGGGWQREVALLREENAELRTRVEVLEEIATSGSLTSLPEARAKVEELHELEMASRRAR